MHTSPFWLTWTSACLLSISHSFFFFFFFLFDVNYSYWMRLFSFYSAFLSPSATSLIAAMHEFALRHNLSHFSICYTSCKWKWLMLLSLSCVISWKENFLVTNSNEPRNRNFFLNTGVYVCFCFCCCFFLLFCLAFAEHSE